MKPSELYRKAAQKIEEAGWIQGNFSRDKDDPMGCGYCVVGAMMAAVEDGLKLPMYTMSNTEAVMALRDVQVEREATGYPKCAHSSFLLSWNDREDQTAEEVIGALKNMADACEKGAW